MSEPSTLAGAHKRIAVLEAELRDAKARSEDLLVFNGELDRERTMALQSHMAEKTKLQETLAAIEWLEIEGVPICLYCRRWKSSGGHAKNCKVGEAIAKGKR